MKEQDDELNNFDPMAELLELNRSLSGNPGGKKDMSIGQRKDTWKMNYKMKNNLEHKAEKETLIQEVIIPKLKETVVESSVNPLIEDTKALITQIDEYDEHSRDLDTKLS